MNQHGKILEDLIHLTNLFLNFLNSLFPFLDYGLIESNLIVQQQDFLSAR